MVYQIILLKAPINVKLFLDLVKQLKEHEVISSRVSQILRGAEREQNPLHLLLLVLLLLRLVRVHVIYLYECVLCQQIHINVISAEMYLLVVGYLIDTLHSRQLICCVGSAGSS